MASKKRSECRGQVDEQHWVQSGDTPESRYHTAQNTPDVQIRDNNSNNSSNSSSNNGRRRHQEQHQVVVPPAPNMAAAALKREETMARRTTELGLRMSEVVLCLVSASIMATDRNQGWAGDSYDRYKEYKYCLGVNVIGCLYSGFQACEKAYHLVSSKNKRFFTPNNLRSHFDYLMDQVVAYLLVSASSSAATRVKDWESNWGKDEFTEKASASIVVAFLAFIAFAISSLISFFKLGASFSSST